MKVYHSLIIVLFVCSFFGCEKPHDSEGLSGTTFYPDFFLNGNKLQQPDITRMVIHNGGSLPDIKAEAGGVELDFTISAKSRYFENKGPFDLSKPDFYDVTYSGTNKDGYSGGIEIPIVVAPPNGDLVNDIQGLYTSTIFRNGTSAPQYTDMEYIFIVKTGANTYAISDGVAGWYDLGRALGLRYLARDVIITANDISTNDFSFTKDFVIGPWTPPDKANVTSMTVDAPEKQIIFTVKWEAGFTFVITLTQVSTP